jgi:hypothetical protein
MAMQDGHPRNEDRYLWTDEDFDVMGWHDVRVHAISFEANDGVFDSVSTVDHYPISLGNRLLLDVDYIVDWVRPTAPEHHFSFWISPATLVFENVQQIAGGEFDLVPGYGILPDIQSLVRSEPHPSGVSDWAIEGHNFTLSHSSTGYRQYLRRPPISSTHQYLSLEERGGISFAEHASWARNVAFLSSFDFPAAQAVGRLLDGAEARWSGQLISRTSMYSLLFTLPGRGDSSFPEDVRVSWDDGVFEFSLHAKGHLITADRAREQSAPQVLDAFLYQLVAYA